MYLNNNLKSTDLFFCFFAVIAFSFLINAIRSTVADYNTNVKLAELSSVRPDRLEKIANTALTTCANCYQKLKDR